MMDQIMKNESEISDSPQKTSQELNTSTNPINLVQDLNQQMSYIKEGLKSQQQEMRVKSLKDLHQLMSIILDKPPQQITENSALLITIIQLSLEKLRDVYCALFSVQIIAEFLHRLSINYQNNRNLQEFILTKELITNILKQCSTPNFHVPAYNYKTRHAVFRIYQTFILNKSLLLDQIEPTLYVSAVLNGIDVEKDPRNLVITYDLIYFILRNYAANVTNQENLKLIEPFIDELFDKVSCYFPINFEPPKDDKYKISPELLKEKLNRCFTATPLFQRYSFPFILDKLNSPQVDTKQECFVLLKKMIESYDHSQDKSQSSKYQNHLTVALNQTMNEYFNSYDEEMQELASQSICAILKTIHENTNKGITLSHIAQDFEDVIKKCLNYIDESPESINAFLSSALISNIAVQSNELQEVILNQFLKNHILVTLKAEQESFLSNGSAQSIPRISAYIQIMINLFDKISGQSIKESAQKFITDESIKFQILHLVDQSFDLIKVQPVLFEKGLKLLASLTKFKNFSEISNITTNQQNLQQNDVDMDGGLETSQSNKFSKYIMKLRDIILQSENQTSQQQSLNGIIIEQLQVIKKANQQCRDIVNQSFGPIISQIYQSKSIQGLNQKSIYQLLGTLLDDYQIARLSLEIINNNLQDFMSEQNYQELYQNLKLAVSNFKSSDKEQTSEYQQVISQSLNRMLQHSFDSSQQNFKIVIDFTNLLLMKLDDSQITQTLLKLLSVHGQMQSGCYYLGLIKSILRKRKINMNEIVSRQELKQFLMTPQDSQTLKQFSKIIFLIILKSEKKLDESFLSMFIRPQNQTNVHMLLQLQIVAALIVRGDTLGYNMLKALIKSQENLPEIVKYYDQTITKSHLDKYTKEKGFQVYKLYPQRLFSTIYQTCLELYHKEETKSFGIQLIMQTCKILQLQQLQDKIQELLPIAVEALKLNSCGFEIKITAIQLFKRTLQDEDNKLNGSQYLDSFVNFIIESIQPDMSLQFKIESLNTLTEVSQYKLSKFREPILRKAQSLLDDPKRAVRKFARNCINEWMNM
eukprot:403371479